MKMASRTEALIFYLHLDHINFPINYWLKMYGDSDWIKEYSVTIIFIQAHTYNAEKNITFEKWI